MDELVDFIVPQSSPECAANFLLGDSAIIVLIEFYEEVIKPAEMAKVHPLHKS